MKYGGTPNMGRSGFVDHVCLKVQVLYRVGNAAGTCWGIFSLAVQPRSDRIFSPNVQQVPGKNDRTGFFVPTLRRVFGCLQPHEIAASRDLMGEFVRRPLP